MLVYIKLTIEHSTTCDSRINLIYIYIFIYNIYIYKCRSCHKAIMVITVRAHCNPLDIYIYIYNFHTKMNNLTQGSLGQAASSEDFSASEFYYTVHVHT